MLVGESLELMKGVRGEKEGGIDRGVVNGCNMDKVIDCVFSVSHLKMILGAYSLV